MELFKKVYFLICTFIFIFTILLFLFVFLLQENDKMNTYNYSDELIERRAHQRTEIIIER